MGELIVNNSDKIILDEEFDDTYDVPPDIMDATHVMLKKSIFIPPYLFSIGNITTLLIFDCNIRYLSKDIYRLQNLKIFILTGTKVEKLPETICYLSSSLESLIVHRNKLKLLPSRIGLLSNLKKLWCQDNNILELKIELCDLTNLESFMFDKHLIRNIPLLVQKWIQKIENAEKRKKFLKIVASQKIRHNANPVITSHITPIFSRNISLYASWSIIDDLRYKLSKEFDEHNPDFKTKLKNNVIELFKKEHIFFQKESKKH